MPNRSDIDQKADAQRILQRVAQDAAIGTLAPETGAMREHTDAIDALGTRIGRALAILISLATIAGFVWFFFEGR